MQNTLYYGDNLDILRRHVPDESVDLIYLDPPFNSSRTYNLLFKQHKGDSSPAQIMAFEDTWQWSKLLYDEFMGDMRNVKLFDLVDSFYKILGGSEMMAYVVMMAPRLLELHRTLKPTGSLYLHCDPVASHYLKMCLDVAFGPQNFRNEVIWKRTTAHSSASKWGPVHDTILFFSRSDRYLWNPITLAYSDSYVSSKYRHSDSKGTYRLDNLTGAGVRNGDSGRPWRGFDPTPLGRHWAVPLSPLQSAVSADALRAMCTQEKLDKLDELGHIYFGDRGRSGSSAFPQYKRYMAGGTPIQDVILDVQPINSQAKERRGYPTQKPLALLERIIAASSNEGDVVMDPFAGCGTAVVAAERMSRQWIGIDITYLAIAEVIHRLAAENVEGREAKYTVVGSPTDAYSARKFFEETKPQNHKPFEMWAVSLVQGEPIEKKGGDRGIDGRIPIYEPGGKLRWAMVQVKGGHLGPTLIRDFGRVIEREKALFGLFICLNEPTKQMRQEAEELGIVEGFGVRRIPRLQILTIKELLEDKKRFDLPEGYMPHRHAGVGRAQVEHPALEFG